MTVAETLALARSYGVEVRLNAAGDGLDLEVEADPPSALVKVLRRAKWDILAALRQHDPLPDLLERHRPLLGAVEDARPPDASRASMASIVMAFCCPPMPFRASD